MSFEGYYQILCKKGHLTIEDCYDDPNFDDDCGGIWTCVCGEKAAWRNLVDITNGSFCCDCETGCKFCNNGRIDGLIELEIEQECVTTICDKCGHTSASKKIYKIPSKGDN